MPKLQPDLPEAAKAEVPQPEGAREDGGAVAVPLLPEVLHHPMVLQITPGLNAIKQTFLSPVL